MYRLKINCLCNDTKYGPISKLVTDAFDGKQFVNCKTFLIIVLYVFYIRLEYLKIVIDTRWYTNFHVNIVGVEKLVSFRRIS